MVQISGSPFTQYDFLNITNELRIRGIKVNPGGGDDIVEVSVNYLVEIDDDVVIGTGTLNITLPLASTSIKRITIVAETASTLTILLSGSDTLSGAVTNPVVAPASVTLVATSSNNWIGV